MKEKDYLLETCKHCGNKGLLKIVANYKQRYDEIEDYSVVFSSDTTWLSLECPVCNGISLYKSYTDDTMYIPNEMNLMFQWNIREVDMIFKMFQKAYLNLIRL